MATSIEQSSLWADIREIMKPGPNKEVLEYRVMIHTKTHDIVPYKLVGFHETAEFDTSVGETCFAEFLIPTGEYNAKVYPSRANLEVSIKTVPKIKGEVPVSRKFRALFSSNSPVPTGGQSTNLSEDDQNMAGFTTVMLELIDKGLEVMSLAQTGDAYSNIKQGDLLRLVLGKVVSGITIGGSKAIDAIDIVEPHNQDPFPQVLIPDGTPVLKLPTYLQDQIGGVYSTGLGTFVRNYSGKKTLFIYPLHDFTRFDKESRRLIIYAIPKDRYSGIDKTFKKDGSILKVLTSSDLGFEDDGDVGSMNEGSGVRITDARALMKKPVIITETGIKAARSQLNHEVAISSREDGYSKGSRVSTPSANPYKEFSRLKAAEAKKVTVKWDYARPDLLFPGMPVKIVFLQDGERAEVKGTLLKTLSSTKLSGSSSSENYVTNSDLVIACEKLTKAPKQTKSDSTGKF